MKSTLLIFAILISSLHSLSAQSLYYYGYTDTRVYKADTLGNVYWVKNFAGKIDSTSFHSNIVRMVRHKADRVIVYIVQAPVPSPSSPELIHETIVTLDTNGTVLNCINWQNYARFIGPSTLPSFDSGFRIMFNGLSNYYYMNSIKIDHDGNIDTNAYSFGLSTAGHTELKQLLVLPDSTFLTLSHSYSNFTTLNILTVAKFGSNGQQIWSISSDTWSIVLPHSIVTDPKGDFYVIGFSYDYSSAFGIKGDSSGNILYTRFWLNQLTDDFHFLSYRNDTVINQYAHSISPQYQYSNIYFDTTFISSCLTDTTLSLQVAGPSSISGSSLQVNTTSYCTANPYNDTLTVSPITSVPFNPPTYPDYCNILSVIDVHESTTFRVFPNPANERLEVYFPGFVSMNISVYDISGAEVIRTTLKSDEFLDVSSLANGLYFLKVEQPGISSGTRFLIQR